MKIESIKDITDESLQTLSASAVSDFIEDELKKASENFSAEKSKFEDQLKEHREKATALETSQEQLKSDLESAKESLEKLETERAAKEAEEKFNQRMSIMDEEYVLSNEDRQIIVNDVKDMVDEDFETYSKKMSVLLSAKKRETVEAAAKTEVEAEAPKEVEEKTEEVAEVETIDATSEEVSEIVEQAVEGAEVDKGMVPNSIDATEPDVYDRYKKAFSLDQFDLSL